MVQARFRKITRISPDSFSHSAFSAYLIWDSPNHMSKRFFLRFFLFLPCVLQGMMNAWGQTLSLKELSSIPGTELKKLENGFSKKGFRRIYSEQEGYAASFLREQRTKSDSLLSMRMIHWVDGHSFIYQTTDIIEDSLLIQEIVQEGFHFPSLAESGQTVFQKGEMVIEYHREWRDSLLYHELKFSRKDLPKRKELVFAEDLLQLESHAHLSEVFGEENLKRDVFYFTPQDSNYCSVLFPGSSSEAVFLWNDEVNLRQISFILIGDPLHQEENKKHVAVGYNQWRSRQRIYCGMELRELHQLNGTAVRFFNWHTESPGYSCTDNVGNVDFNRIGLVFSCLNCGYAQASNKEITDSGLALMAHQKVFVSSMIILPEKREGSNKGSR